MTLKPALFAAALACGLATSSMAGAATIAIQTTPGGVAAATGLKGATVDFSDVPVGEHSAFSRNGVTFTSDSQPLYVDGAYSGQFNSFGRSLSQMTAYNFAFDSAVDGFGFFFGATDYEWTLSAFDESGELIETMLISPVHASNAGDFFGIKAAGIKRARLTSAEWDYVLLDNFTLGGGMPTSAVPEPATWAMMISGFGMAGAVLRRRRSAVAVA